jgi:glycosyltransferase involved in cell wall biosynthesis
MRILLLNQFFYPDTAATSQLLTDLARELVTQGHEVVAICAQGDYASSRDLTALPSVTIIRSALLPFSHSPCGRLASYAGYFLTAAVQSLRGPAPDVVLTLTTPPLLSLVGTLVKRWRGGRHFIWEMDLYPDVAVDLGVFRPQSPLTKLIGAVADYSRHRADGILALGDDMQERLLGHQVPASRIQVVHNWADRSEIHPQAFPRGPLTVHYSGNLGLAHDTATIQQTMLKLAGDEHIHFTFAGGGPQRKALQAFCEREGLSRVTFRPYCSRDQLSSSLAEGHLGLVTQKPETTGSIVPSKVYGIMAAGRPLLYIGSHRATPARIIERFGCGWSVEAGESDKLVELLTRLAHRPNEISEAGERARRAFVDHFDRRLGVDAITTFIGAKPQRAAASA